MHGPSKFTRAKKSTPIPPKSKFQKPQLRTKFNVGRGEPIKKQLTFLEKCGSSIDMNGKVDDTETALVKIFDCGVSSSTPIFKRDYKKLVAAYRCGASSDEELSCTRYKSNGKGCCFAVEEYGMKTCVVR